MPCAGGRTCNAPPSAPRPVRRPRPIGFIASFTPRARHFGSAPGPNNDTPPSQCGSLGVQLGDVEHCLVDGSATIGDFVLDHGQHHVRRVGLRLVEQRCKRLLEARWPHGRTWRVTDHRRGEAQPCAEVEAEPPLSTRSFALCRVSRSARELGTFVAQLGWRLGVASTCDTGDFERVGRGGRSVGSRRAPGHRCAAERHSSLSRVRATASTPRVPCDTNVRHALLRTATTRRCEFLEASGLRARQRRYETTESSRCSSASALRSAPGLGRAPGGSA